MKFPASLIAARRCRSAVGYRPQRQGRAVALSGRVRGPRGRDRRHGQAGRDRKSWRRRASMRPSDLHGVPIWPGAADAHRPSPHKPRSRRSWRAVARRHGRRPARDGLRGIATSRAGTHGRASTRSRTRWIRKLAALNAITLTWALLAAAVAQSPDMLIADHAFAGLTPTEIKTVVAALLAEQKRIGFALLYAARGLQDGGECPRAHDRPAAGPRGRGRRFRQVYGRTGAGLYAHAVQGDGAAGRGAAGAHTARRARRCGAGARLPAPPDDKGPKPRGSGVDLRARVEAHRARADRRKRDRDGGRRCGAPVDLERLRQRARGAGPGRHEHPVGGDDHLGAAAAADRILSPRQTTRRSIRG